MRPGSLFNAVTSTFLRAGTTHGIAFVLFFALATSQARASRPTLSVQKRGAVDGQYSIASQPNADGNVYVQVFGDGDPAMEYSKGWTVRTTTSLNLTDGTEHVTVAPSAKLSFAFRGTALSLIGTTGPNHGRFSVRIDETLHSNLTSKRGHALMGQTIFNVQGLDGSAAHEFVLKHEDKRGVELDVDAVVVWGDAETTPSPTPSTATTFLCGEQTQSPNIAKLHTSSLPSASRSGGIGFPGCPTSSTISSLSVVSTVSLTRDISSLLQTGLPSANPGHPVPAGGADSARHRSAAIIGGVLGSLAGLALISSLGLFAYRRHQKGESVWGGPAGSLTVHSGGSPTTSSTGDPPTGTDGSRNGGGMVETLADRGIAGGLLSAAHRQEQPHANTFPRSFDVTSRPTRSFGPTSSLTPVTASSLTPSLYQSSSRPGMPRRPATGESYASGSAETSTGESQAQQWGRAVGDVKHITLQTTWHKRPSSADSNSSMGNRSPSTMMMDPYLSRRSSVLSVRNPDVGTSPFADPSSTEDLTEGLVNFSPRDGSPADLPARSSLDSQSHSGHAHSSREMFDSVGSLPPPSTSSSFPGSAAFAPIDPTAAAAAARYGPSSWRRPISTIGEAEDETWHSLSSALQTPATLDFPERGRRSPPGESEVSRSARTTPGGGSDTASLAPPLPSRTWRPSLDGASSVGTPSSVQYVGFNAYPFNVPRQPPPEEEKP